LFVTANALASHLRHVNALPVHTAANHVHNTTHNQ
jgi:hypothetical protein